MKNKPIFAFGLSVFLIASGSAFAWAWIYPAAQWALTSVNASRVAFVTNAGLRSATAKSLSLHASVAGVALAAPHVIDSNPQGGEVPAHVMIDLSGEGRINPDPNRYDDAAPGELDPSPKQQYDPISGLPLYAGTINWLDILDSMGAPAYKVFSDGKGGVYKAFTVSYTIGRKAPLTSDTQIYDLNDDPSYSHKQHRHTKDDGSHCSWVTQDSCNGIAIFAKYESPSQTCAVGYEKSGDGSCTLIDSTQVEKPEKTIPCEINYVNGKFESDSKNPSCQYISLSPDVHVETPTDDSVRIENASEVLVTSCGAAGCEAVYADKTDSSWVKYTLSQPDQNKYRTVTSVETGTGPAPTPTAPGGSGGTPGGGSGGDTGGGDTGGGSGLGCTVGQPCHVLVDDSGFADKPTDLDGLNSRLDEDTDNWLGAITSVSYDDMHGVEFDWLPSVPKASCSPISYGYQDHRLELDFCGEKIALIKEVLGWLMYLFTGWTIVNIFFDRSSSK